MVQLWGPEILVIKWLIDYIHVNLLVIVCWMYIARLKLYKWIHTLRKVGCRVRGVFYALRLVHHTIDLWLNLHYGLIGSTWHVSHKVTKWVHLHKPGYYCMLHLTHPIQIFGMDSLHLGQRGLFHALGLVHHTLDLWLDLHYCTVTMS